MKTFSVLLPFLANLRLISAHATVFAAWINDVDQGVGNNPSGYVRSPPNNNPVKDVNSGDMTCNVNGRNAVARTLIVKPGDKFTFEWHHNNRDPGDDIIDGSHKGPVLVYIAPAAAGTAGNGWVKIYEDGFDPSTQTWAVTKLINNKGFHSVTIPNIAPGDYLLRAEIIALHEAFMKGGAQFYMECIQVKITQSGGVALPAGVSIPGVYSADDPGVFFNLYGQTITNYPIPGPRVASIGGSGTTTPSSSSSSASSSTVRTSTSAGGSQSTQSTFSTSTVRTSVSTTTTQSQSPPATTTSKAVATTSTSSIPTSPSSSPAPTPNSCQGGDVSEWQQCGGINYTGPTRCKNGLICKEWNPYYFQCIFP